MSRQTLKCCAVVTALALMATGCGNSSSGPIQGSGHAASAARTEDVQQDLSEKITLAYNREIKAIVKKLNTDAEVIVLKNAEGGGEYTLTYSSGTTVWDKYENSKSIDQVKCGDVVEAYIDDNNSRLAAICYSSENWEFQGSENWKFDTEKSELNIGKEKYYYMDNLVVLSEDEEVNIMDLNESDVLNIQGCGKKILSVTVEQGHGYVKLEGIEDFIDGWVQIGKVIKPISKDMLMVVPEGSWDVVIAKDGYGGSIGVNVERNEESTVDFSGVAAQIVRYGAVEFTIEPEDARLYIAGREVDYAHQILLEYDTYKIRVSADGYEDYTGDLKVNKALLGRKITLSKVSASTTPAVTATAVDLATASPSTTSVLNSNSSESTTVGDYKIQINTPENVNVYFDDAFVGISPVSFAKVSGQHTVTLSKSGYKTKSYSIEVGTEERDVKFELPDLEHED